MNKVGIKKIFSPTETPFNGCKQQTKKDFLFLLFFEHFHGQKKGEEKIHKKTRSSFKKKKQQKIDFFGYFSMLPPRTRFV